MKTSILVILLVAFLGECIVCTWIAPRGCPTVRLANGRVRSRARGRIIRFSCYAGFTLVGNKYSTCIRGEWDTPTPVCINAECVRPPTPEHALMVPKYNGAILIYFCEPGFALIGGAEIYCDGKQYNGTAPHCRDTSAAAPTQCDFEKPDLCWWEQDPQHDFDWRRHNFETPSSHIGTGPTHDHTLGPGNEGYYLYIEASGRLVNDTARIFSPLYNSSYTDGGCFSFWYHMFGATVGALNVYFKEETESIPNLMFTKQGNQGNQWQHGIFNLPKVDKFFQIIIEGVRGASYVSDIAIDDVAILQGDKCNTDKMETVTIASSDDDQVELVNAQQSCRGRCRNTTWTSFTTMIPSSPLEVCSCTQDCADLSTCCPDYAEYCVLAINEEGSTEATEYITSNHVAPVSESLPVKNVFTTIGVVTEKPDYPNRNGISINPKDDIDPITLRSLTVTISSTIANVSKMSPVKPFTISKTTRYTRQPVVSTKEIQTKETPFPSTTTVTSRYVPRDEHPDPDTRIQDPKKLHRGTTKIGLPGIIGAIVGILTGLSITLMVAFFIVKKTKSYKRGKKGSALSEDSDVRFLTSDEILDFTLARPSENDEA